MLIEETTDIDLRKKLWLQKNLINENINYIKKLLNHFHISKWIKAINIRDEHDLLLEHKKKSYKIIVKNNILALQLLENNLEKQRKNKKIYNISKHAGINGNFYGDDCWFNVLKWIKENS